MYVTKAFTETCRLLREHNNSKKLGVALPGHIVQPNQFRERVEVRLRQRPRKLVRLCHSVNTEQNEQVLFAVRRRGSHQSYEIAILRNSRAYTCD